MTARPLARKQLYCVRVGDSFTLAEAVPYDVLLSRIMEFTVRAAVARSLDDCEWEEDALRRNGLLSLEISRNGKALWADRRSFAEQLAEARREGVEGRFREQNALDASLCRRLDRDLRARWRSAGYQTPSLIADMKKLFAELERDLADRTASAREGFVREIVPRV